MTSSPRVRSEGVEFVVFWWEPLGTIDAAAKQLAHSTNDLLDANDVPALEEIHIVAHSVAGIVTALAAPSLHAPRNVRFRISTIGTPYAGMNGPDFGYSDNRHSLALFATFTSWLRYPPVPDGIEVVEYHTTWPEDPVMEPRLGHDPAPLDIGPQPRRRVQLPHMDHNKCVGLVVERLLRGED